MLPGETTIVGLLGKDMRKTTDAEMAVGPVLGSTFEGGDLADSKDHVAGIERCEACPYDEVYRGGTNKNVWNQYVCFYKPDGEVAASDVFNLDKTILAEEQVSEKDQARVVRTHYIK